MGEALTGDWWSARRSLIDFWRGLEGKREGERSYEEEEGNSTNDASLLSPFSSTAISIVQIIQPHDSISIYHRPTIS